MGGRLMGAGLSMHADQTPFPCPLRPPCSLSGALAQGLMSAGNSSQLLQLEDEFVVGAGGTQAPYLRGLVDAISYLVPPP